MLKKRSFRNGRLSELTIGELERMMAEEFPTPGDRWPTEAELADRFAVSRIVIREAMKVLKDRGVVEVQAGRGTFTCAPSVDRVKLSLLRLFPDQPTPKPDEMERMLELREVLEEAVAGLAAVRAEPEDLRAIETALDAMSVDQGDIRQTIEADLRFHLAVARAAHNHFFEMVLDPLTQVYVQQIALTDSFTVGVEHHRRIYQEISRRNPIGARQAARRLIQLTRSDLRKAFTVLRDGRGVQPS
jgi:DNA-binding FadR family transcriptional regulator